MVEAFIASVGYAGGVIVDKITLARYKVPINRFVTLLFVLLALLTAVFLPKWGNFPLHFDWRFFLLFAGMIAVAVIWNLLYYRGISKEELHEFELIMLLSPLMTIIFAGIFLPDERNLPVFIAGLLASLTFVFSRFKKHHLLLSKVAKGTLLAMLLLSFESILIKLLLGYLTPVTLYFTRTLVIAIVFSILYRPSVLKMQKEAFALIVISAIFGIMNMVLKFYGFQSLGVVETTMVLLLGPIFVYLFSYFFFQEKKFFAKDAISAGVIVLCIIYATFWK